MSKGTVYRDGRGWLYKVMPGLGADTFKARYHKPGARNGVWKCVASLPWRPSKEEAQDDLDSMAKKKGWTPEGEV